MKTIRLALLASSLCVISLAAVANAAPTFAPPPPTAPHLKTYSQWGALWWQWAIGTPNPNPLLDTTGANCAAGQLVPGTFFLAGTLNGSTVSRSCTVPVGDAFLIPILNLSYLAQQTDPPEQRTEAFVRSQVTCVESSPTLSLTVDGVALPNPQRYLEKSVLFSVNLPPNNIYGLPPQLLSPAADEGYYAFLEPLSAGSHTVHIKAFSAACGGATQDTTYRLIVQGTVGTPRSCSGTQQLTLNNVDIQSTGAALTVSGNCNVTINNSVLFGGTSAIVVHDQGHVIVNTSVVGGGPGPGGFAVSADGHGHVELRNSAVISPTSALGFSIISDSGGNTSF